jgi:hypothetical protein
MNPQDYDSLFEKLYKSGALEVFLTPTIMKHSRPGILLTVLCQNRINKITNIIFEDTTTLGLRMNHTRRIKLKRHILKLSTPYGGIRVKIAEYNGKKKFSLEYQDLKKLAKKNNKSIRELRNRLTRFVEQKISKLRI